MACRVVERVVASTLAAVAVVHAAPAPLRRRALIFLLWSIAASAITAAAAVSITFARVASKFRAS